MSNPNTKTKDTAEQKPGIDILLEHLHQVFVVERSPGSIDANSCFYGKRLRVWLKEWKQSKA